MGGSERLTTNTRYKDIFSEHNLETDYEDPEAPGRYDFEKTEYKMQQPTNGVLTGSTYSWHDTWNGGEFYAWKDDDLSDGFDPDPNDGQPGGDPAPPQTTDTSPKGYGVASAEEELSDDDPIAQGLRNSEVSANGEVLEYTPAGWANNPRGYQNHLNALKRAESQADLEEARQEALDAQKERKEKLNEYLSQNSWNSRHYARTGQVPEEYQVPLTPYELQQRELERNIGQNIGLFFASFIPGVGEALDIAVIVHPNTTLTQKSIAGASLAINLVLWGLAPNYGHQAANLLEDGAEEAVENTVEQKAKDGVEKFAQPEVVGPTKVDDAITNRMRINNKAKETRNLEPRTPHTKSPDDLPKSQQKTVRSLRDRIAEHRKKLDDYMKDPDAFDNQGLLKNAPTPEIRQMIIDGRINHIESEIRVFQGTIDSILGGG